MRRDLTEDEEFYEGANQDDDGQLTHQETLREG